MLYSNMSTLIKINMYRYFFTMIIFLVLIPASVIGQTKEIDEKQQILVDSLLRFVEQNSQTKPDAVLDLAKKMVETASKNKYLLLEARSNNAMASVYYYKNDKKKAVKYFERELEILEKLGNVPELADSYFNLATLAQSMDRNKDAAEYYENSLKYAKQKQDREMELALMERLALVYEKLEKFKQAFNYYQQYINVKEQRKSQEVESELLTLRSKISEEKKQSEEIILKKEKEIQRKTKEIKKKQDELKVTKTISDSLKKDVDQKSEKITELHINNIQKEFTIQEKEKQVAEQRKMIIRIVIGGAVLLFFLIVVISLYRAVKRVNRLLKIKNAEIQQQKEEIEAQRDEIEAQRDFIARQNQDITDSIHYAKQIQTALIPEFSFQSKIFSEYFVWFNPRDIVSGDFYWCAETSDHIIIAAADCTGHGVPGAFMSMLGMAFLDEVVNKEKQFSPDLILDSIRKGIISSLKQQAVSSQSKDGMDITVISVDIKKKTVSFAGANNPIYVFHNDQLTEYKGDRMPVSNYPKIEPFTLHQFDIKPGMMLYMFSDGFADQFGGPDNSKFKYKPFKRMLEENHKHKAEMQRSIIEQTFVKWRGNLNQVDDILVIGIRF